MPDLSDAVAKVSKTVKRLLDKTTVMHFSEEEFGMHEDDLQRHAKYISMCMHRENRRMLDNATVTCCVLGILENVQHNRHLKGLLENGDYDVICIDEARVLKKRHIAYTSSYPFPKKNFCLRFPKKFCGFLFVSVFSFAVYNLPLKTGIGIFCGFVSHLFF